MLLQSKRLDIVNEMFNIYLFYIGVGMNKCILIQGMIYLQKGMTYECLLLIYLLDKSHYVLMNMVCYAVTIKKVSYIQ